MVLDHKHNEHDGLRTLEHNANDPCSYPCDGLVGPGWTFAASLSFIMMFYLSYTSHFCMKGLRVRMMGKKVKLLEEDIT